MNKRKEAGTSRSKSKSTVSDSAYANMKKGFPKKMGGLSMKYMMAGQILFYLIERTTQTLAKIPA